ncbi:V-type ATP synthase subunit D [Streptosporangium sp. NPDC051022]|uniref:V-type ATP synthase subunit D n=1 Tax=Streptosporangium sp. NPDC051022 TaxID=3155752 RepID=UPI003415C347
MTSRVPPGRAGRMRLLRRLAAARRGLVLLDRKLRILRREQERLALLTSRTGEEWKSTCRAADTWLLRVTMLGGRRAVRLAVDGRLTDVRVDWVDAMGTSYPDRFTCRPPRPDGSAPLPVTSALVPAREAYLAALRAALKHAVASEAARIVAAEAAMTGRRVRSLRDHLLPRLEEALAAVALSLDEMERSDGARVRRAIGSGEGATRDRSNPARG